MKRVLLILGSVLVILATALPYSQAISSAPTGSTTASSLNTGETIDGVGDVDSSQLADATAAKTGWKLGVYPAPATICIADGIGGDTKAVLGRWNDAAYGALRLSILNRCDGYSITNRMTVTHYSAAGTSCVKFTNTGNVWDTRQQMHIWNQNIVVWLNSSDYCSGGDPPRVHRMAMYVGYILGVKYVYCSTTCNYVMCYTSWCLNNVYYVTTNDRRLMAAVYGLVA